MEVSLKDHTNVASITAYFLVQYAVNADPCANTEIDTTWSEGYF